MNLNGALGVLMKGVVVATVLCIPGAFIAKADAVYSVTVTTGVPGCAPTDTGTLGISSSGGIYFISDALSMSHPKGSCYVGGGPQGTPSFDTYIGGLSGEESGSSAQTLVQGWIATSGEYCSDINSCNSSNNTTNDGNSGDIDAMFNPGNTAATFTLTNSDSKPNAMFTCPARSICIENATTGSSIGFTINNPIPEPATFLLMGSGLIGFGAFVRKRRLSR